MAQSIFSVENQQNRPYPYPNRTEMRVSVGGEHFEHSVVDRQQRHVESASAQVEHENVLLALLLVKTVRDRRRRPEKGQLHAN